MNETMSLLLVSAVLAAGGLGLYMYKSSDDSQKGGDDYDEDTLFDMTSIWNTNSEDDVDSEEPEIYEPKVKSRGGKTKRNKRSGGSKRKY